MVNCILSSAAYPSFLSSIAAQLQEQQHPLHPRSGPPLIAGQSPNRLIYRMSTAFDRRRVPAPEVSQPPIFEPLPSAEAGPSKRVDRRDDEARPIYLKTALISQANGSGYIESGGVKIACSV
jgi:hypothetical protein